MLAANRFIPIQLAPDYSEGFVKQSSRGLRRRSPVAMHGRWFLLSYFVYPTSKGRGLPGSAPTTERALPRQVCTTRPPALPLLNPPTSWYWNIRIGDKIQINNSGISTPWSAR